MSKCQILKSREGALTETNKVLKSAVWYTASNLLIKASGFITVPIFTRILTQSEYGQYNNFLSWAAVLGVVCSMSLESTLISAKYDYRDNFSQYAFSISCMGVCFACGWWLMVVCAMGLASAIMDLQPVYINAMFIYLAFQPVVNIFQAYERFQFKYVATVVTSAAVSLGSALMSVALILVADLGLMGAIAGRVVPMAAVGIVLMMILYRQGKKIDVSAWKYALPIALPFVPHLLAMTLLGSLNKIFIQQMYGSEQNALYSLANNCALVISLLTTSLNGAFAPWLGEKLAEHNYEITKRLSRPYVGLFALLASGVCLLAPEIMLILGGEEYLGAAKLIPAISMGAVFQFVYCMYVNIEQFEKKTVGMAAASVSAAGLNALLDYLFLPKYGYEFAAAATALSYGWLLFVHMLLVKRMGLTKAYDTRYILLSLACCGVVFWGVSLFYSNIAIRVLCGLIVAVVLIRQLPRLRQAMSS